MMQYLVIDTCVILHILRGNQLGQKSLEEMNKIDNNVISIISVVTKGELESLKIQQSWGQNRTGILDAFLENITYIDILNTDTALIESYSKIDAYSQGKSADKHGNMLSNSSRNMGKNDLWIAATASTLEVPLLTADGDFDHLHGTFIKVIKIQ